MACLDQLGLVRGLVRGLTEELVHLLAPDQMKELKITPSVPNYKSFQKS